MKKLCVIFITCLCSLYSLDDIEPKNFLDDPSFNDDALFNDMVNENDEDGNKFKENFSRKIQESNLNKNKNENKDKDKDNKLESKLTKEIIEKIPIKKTEEEAVAAPKEPIAVAISDKTVNKNNAKRTSNKQSKRKIPIRKARKQVKKQAKKAVKKNKK